MAATKRVRRDWGSLTREEIMDAAARRVNDHGFEGLSIRELARDVGTSPMAIYGHVRDKDEITDELTERLLASRWAPRAPSKDWRTYVVSSAERLRDLLVAEPVVLHTYLSHPVTSSSALARMEAMLESLRLSGLDAKQAGHAYAAIHTYTIGFAALEASRAKSGADSSSGEMARKLRSFTSSAQFRRGLDLVLDGLSVN